MGTRIMRGQLIVSTTNHGHSVERDKPFHIFVPCVDRIYDDAHGIVVPEDWIVINPQDISDNLALQTEYFPVFVEFEVASESDGLERKARYTQPK